MFKWSANSRQGTVYLPYLLYFKAVPEVRTYLLPLRLALNISKFDLLAIWRRRQRRINSD